MFYGLVIDLSPIQRIASTEPDVLLLYILGPLGGLMLLSILVWAVGQLWLSRKSGQFAAKQKRVTIAIDIPVNEQTPKAVENIFAIIKGTKSVITMKEKWMVGKFLQATSFEIVCIDGYIQFYVNTNAFYRDHVEAAIYSQYPDAEIAEVEDYTTGMPSEFPNDTHEIFGGEITLSRPTYLPIKTYEEFEHMASKDQRLKDPLVQLFEHMGKYKQGEQFWLHIIVHPGDADGHIDAGQKFIMKTFGRDIPQPKSQIQKWAGPLAWIPKEAGSQLGGLIGGADGGGDDKKNPFFVPTNTEKTQLDGVSKKMGKMGFEVKIRWAYVGRHDTFIKGKAATFWKGYIALYAHLDMNKFRYDPDTMPRDDYFWMRWEYRRKQRELMAAMKGRSWGQGSNPMYLSVEELATIWHFPTIETKAPLIKKTEAKRGEAPTYLPMAGVGESDELPTEPLIEVDEQGRPIEKKIEEPMAPSSDDLADILPTGPLVEPGSPEAAAIEDEPEDDQPFVPPNLPV